MRLDHLISKQFWREAFNFIPMRLWHLNHARTRSVRRNVAAALFSSGVFTAPSGAAFSPVTINTGNVVLTPGQQYVLFLTTTNQQPQANSSYRYGSVANTAYNGGQFVFQNNGANFNQLSTNPWSFIAQDLTFQAIMSAADVGENHAQAQS